MVKAFVFHDVLTNSRSSGYWSALEKTFLAKRFEQQLADMNAMPHDGVSMILRRLTGAAPQEVRGSSADALFG